MILTSYSLVLQRRLENFAEFFAAWGEIKVEVSI